MGGARRSQKDGKHLNPTEHKAEKRKPFPQGWGGGHKIAIPHAGCWHYEKQSATKEYQEGCWKPALFIKSSLPLKAYKTQTLGPVFDKWRKIFVHWFHSDFNALGEPVMLKKEMSRHIKESAVLPVIC